MLTCSDDEKKNSCEEMRTTYSPRKKFSGMHVRYGWKLITCVKSRFFNQYRREMSRDDHVAWKFLTGVR